MNKDKLIKYGCFSGCSNLTGIINPIDSICRILHQHGAYSFIDYATLAPYAKININPNITDYRDAIFISPHKFIGGPGCSGVLIMKRYLVKTLTPYIVGGGTVEHVNFNEQIYSRNIEAREEGGTPNIVGNIK